MSAPSPLAPLPLGEGSSIAVNPLSQWERVRVRGHPATFVGRVSVLGMLLPLTRFYGAQSRTVIMPLPAGTESLGPPSVAGLMTASVEPASFSAAGLCAARM